MRTAFATVLLVPVAAGLPGNARAQFVPFTPLSTLNGGAVYAFEADAEGRLFASVSGTGLSYSSDGGQQWTRASVPTGTIFALAVAPDGTVYAGGRGVYRSTDHGALDVGSRPAVAWRAARGAVDYHVQVAGTDDFATLLLDREHVADTTLSLGLQPYRSTHYWRLRAHDGLGYGAWSGAWRFTIATGVATEAAEPPARYVLAQNYPNPFNPTTTFAFELPAPGPVSLAVFDLHGRRVATVVEGVQGAGRHTVSWHAGTLPSGLYFYRLLAGGHVLTRKLTLVR